MKYWHPTGVPEKCTCALCYRYVTSIEFQRMVDGLHIKDGKLEKIINYKPSPRQSLPLAHSTKCKDEGSVIGGGYCTSCDKELAELNHIRYCENEAHTFCIRSNTPIRQSVFEEPIQSCYSCKEYVAMKPNLTKDIKWAYGITTVPSRRGNYFDRTLQSLVKAGFDKPHLFVDGCDNPESYRKEYGLDVSCRYPTIRIYGNWMLSLWELYLRNPLADRYAIFQDDMVTYKNLRKYLESVEYITRGYCNLFTFPENVLKAKEQGVERGWFKSNQMGKGAVALMFDRETVMSLLAHKHMVNRVEDPRRGYELVDGGVVEALNRQLGWVEYCHAPSLVDHIGDISSAGHKVWPHAETFRGENFDAMDLLNLTKEVVPVNIKTPITSYTIVRKCFPDGSGEPIKPGEMHIYLFNEEVQAVNFLCPCGCNSECYTRCPTKERPRKETDKANGIHMWDFSYGPNGPTLFPSIRFISGCKAHFNITDGKVIIHGDSGK